MPTELPLWSFRRMGLERAFTLLETLLSLGILGILLVIAVPDYFPILERQRFENTASEVRGLLEEAQSLALTRQVSHRLGFDLSDHSLLIEHKRSGDYEILQRRPIDKSVSLEATRWPAFGPFGFALSGTVLLHSSAFQTSIIVSSVGRIRQMNVMKK